jgi:hypothetical protein
MFKKIYLENVRFIKKCYQQWEEMFFLQNFSHNDNCLRPTTAFRSTTKTNTFRTTRWNAEECILQPKWKDNLLLPNNTLFFGILLDFVFENFEKKKIFWPFSSNDR